MRSMFYLLSSCPPFSKQTKERFYIVFVRRDPYHIHTTADKCIVEILHMSTIPVIILASDFAVGRVNPDLFPCFGIACQNYAYIGKLCLPVIIYSDTDEIMFFVGYLDGILKAPVKEITQEKRRTSFLNRIG